MVNASKTILLIAVVGAVAFYFLSPPRDIQVSAVRHEMYGGNCKVDFVARNLRETSLQARFTIDAYHTATNTDEADVKDKVGNLAFDRELTPGEDVKISMDIPTFGKLSCDAVYVRAKTL